MSLQLAVVRGIPVRLHITLLVAFLFLTLSFGAWGLPAGVLLFGSVLAHELGHAVVAQHFGIPIVRIDLHMLGGTAVMAGTPRTPRREMLVAAAGPAVSMVLALAFALWAALFGGSLGLSIRGVGDLLAYAGALNFGLAVFNLLPALPMDGGRIFRAALAARMGDLRATRIAATVSRVFAGLFVAVALFTGAFTLGLIGIFLFLIVGQEEKAAEIRARRRMGRYTLGPRPQDTFGPWSTGFGPSDSYGRDHWYVVTIRKDR